MDRPPRNRELERLVIETLRATDIGAPERHEAWQVYADWLLSLGEPVGEWLAASLRADDSSDAAAPVRARLHEIERACSFRLVDLALADLSEVPELARIADLTWERGFITTATIRTREFRAWDSELLEHTPDRLIEVVLGSPSACMLHELRVDSSRFLAAGSRHPSLAGLIAGLDEPLALRRLELGAAGQPPPLDPGMFARLPELVSLRALASIGGSSRDELREQLAALPGGLRELELVIWGGGDQLAELLAGGEWPERLRALSLTYVSDAGAEHILARGDRFAKLARFELPYAELSPAVRAALARLGCSFG